MNAEKLLQRTVASGAAYDIAAAAGTSRTVQCGHLQIAALAPSDDRADVESQMRSVWRKRVGNTALNLLLVADEATAPGQVMTLGPRSAAKDGVRSVTGVQLAPVLAASAEMAALEAVRHVSGEIVRLAGGGLLVGGLLSRHTLDSRLLQDSRLAHAWASACSDIRIDGDWRSPLVKLGWEIERLEHMGYLLRASGRTAAVVHPKRSADDFDRLDPDGRPPEGMLAAACRSHGARFGILACGNRYRLFDCEPAASTAEWLDLDAALLDDDRRVLLGLLAPPYLADGGLDEARRDA